MKLKSLRQKCGDGDGDGDDDDDGDGDGDGCIIGSRSRTSDAAWLFWTSSFWKSQKISLNASKEVGRIG